MAHWQRVLPAGVILDVQYEDVVADLDAQARRMLAHCRLPWDDACLACYDTERAVCTASAAQVRRTIYATSVGRWRAYQSSLQTLLQALDIDDDQLVVESASTRQRSRRRGLRPLSVRLTDALTASLAPAICAGAACEPLTSWGRQIVDKAQLRYPCHR